MKIAKVLVCSSLIAVLALSLAATACAGEGQPAGNGAAADCSSVEQQLAAEKQKSTGLDSQVKDLQAQLAATQQPAKVIRWEPACELAQGGPWDVLNWWSDALNELSDGRIVSTPSAPGAVCPVEEQIETVSAGATGAMMPTPAYYPGKVPAAGAMINPIPKSSMEMMYAYEYFQDGKISDIYTNALESRWNVKVVGYNYGVINACMSLKKPAYRIADLNGLKFRCGDDNFAYGLNKLGASTVWFPSTEIYTGLATGVVDAFTFGGAYDHYALGTHEVTEYWVRTPLCSSRNNQFVINRDVWNELPEDLQNLCMKAVDSSGIRYIADGHNQDDKSWDAVIEAGIEVINWPAEDQAIWTGLMLEYLDTISGDPEAGEIVKVLREFAEYKGYI